MLCFMRTQVINRSDLLFIAIVFFTIGSLCFAFFDGKQSSLLVVFFTGCVLLIPWVVERGGKSSYRKSVYFFTMVYFIYYVPGSLVYVIFGTDHPRNRVWLDLYQEKALFVIFCACSLTIISYYYFDKKRRQYVEGMPRVRAKPLKDINIAVYIIIIVAGVMLSVFMDALKNNYDIHTYALGNKCYSHFLFRKIAASCPIRFMV